MANNCKVASPCPIPPGGYPDIDDILTHVRLIAFKEARRQGLSEDDSADVSQEVSIKAWMAITNGKQIQSYSGWTKRATNNYVIDLHRKRSASKYGADLVETLTDIDESRFRHV